MGVTSEAGTKYSMGRLDCKRLTSIDLCNCEAILPKIAVSSKM